MQLTSIEIYLFGYDIIIYRAINSAKDFKLFQSDNDSARGWYTANYMKSNISKTELTFFSRKPNTLIYGCKLC
jgi:hypothetical protein